MTVTNPLAEAAQAASAIGRATADRDRAVVAARDSGSTWRSIAEAVGLTEMGVRKIYQRTHTLKGN